MYTFGRTQVQGGAYGEHKITTAAGACRPPPFHNNWPNYALHFRKENELQPFECPARLRAALVDVGVA